MFSQKIIILILPLYNTEIPTKTYFIQETLQSFNPTFIYIQNYKLIFYKTDNRKFDFCRFFGVLDHCAAVSLQAIHKEVALLLQASVLVHTVARHLAEGQLFFRLLLRVLPFPPTYIQLPLELCFVRWNSIMQFNGSDHLQRKIQIQISQ